MAGRVKAKKRKQQPTKKPKKAKKSSVREIWTEWANVNTVEECFEAATTDAYGEYEQATGWLTCLEEILGDIHEVLFLGEPVTLEGLDLQNELTVVAIIEKNGKKAKVALDSIELTNPTKAQELWLEAYSEWGGG